MFHNERGFSLVQVLVVAGLLGGLSLVFMQLMKNLGQAQNFAESKSDEIELKSSIRMILNDERFCRVSLAGNGPSGSPSSPVVFEKQNIDEDAEGLDIALYLSNQAGDARTLKKFNGENNPGTDDKSNFGKLKIKTLKLIMNNGIGSNYADSSSHNDVGKISATIEKKNSSTGTREVVMDFNVNVEMSTGQSPENSGETKILSCKQAITNSSITIIGTGEGHDGQSGSSACAAIGQTCVRVLSHNFPKDDPSGTHTHGVRICQSSYNQGLVGVENGNWKDNIHDCSALLGEYTTYLHPSVLRCNATFYAICN